MPTDGIAVAVAAAVALAAIETDAHALQAAAVLLRQTLKLALRILAVVVPRRPGADDIDLRREIGIGDGLAVDVGGAELGKLGTLLEMGEAGELLLEAGDGMVVGRGLDDGRGELESLGIVGRLALDEDAVEEVDARRRLRMVGDEGLGGLRHLRGCELAGLQTEGGEGVVLLGACDLDLLQMGGIALDLHFLAGLADDRQLGEVGEDDDIGAGFVEGGTVFEGAVDDGDGVELLRGAVGGVDIELALAEALELAGHLEVIAIGTARCKKEDGRWKKEDGRWKMDDGRGKREEG